MPTTKITRGNSFARAIDYDLGQGNNRKDQAKIKQFPATKDEGMIKGFSQGQRARLLSTNIAGDAPAEFAAEFKRVAAQKPGIKEPVHKVSINLKPGEHLETHQWLDVGHSYLQEMGFVDAPFLIAQHREKDHEHIHIVASRVDYNGKVVSDAFEKKKARTWAQVIEERYNLSLTPERAEEKGLSRIEIEQAMRTQKTPPKLILQQSITQTLAAHPETPDFVAALERQNISIRVRTKEKEIVGISFGIDGRGFKGGSLGTKFTWQGLQKEGLKYEFERDYERLETASRRRSQTEFESAGSKLGEGTGDEQFVSGTRSRNARSIKSDSGKIGEVGTIDYDDAERVTESARIGSQESRRGKSVARLETEVGDQSEQSAAQSISSPAAAGEPIAEKGNGTVEIRHEGELRRTRRFDSGETETARRFEPETGETVTAEETDETTAAAIRQQRQQIEQHEHNEAEFFRQQESARQFELFNQLSGSQLPVGSEQPVGTGLPPAASAPNGVETSTATVGIASAAVDGLDGQNLPDSIDVAVVDGADTQRALDVLQIPALCNDDYAGSHLSAVHSDLRGDDDLTSLLGNSASDGGTGESNRIGRLDLSSSLRSALDYAELTTKETVEIEASLKAEEVKNLENKKQALEFEEVIGRGLSM